MARIIDSRASIDQTVQIFDDFYGFELVIPSDQYDIVHSYFVGVCSTKQIAANFTVYLFRISQQTGISALELLDYIRGLDKLKMDAFITYYLNTFKSKTSIYGFGVIPQPNTNIQRNIIQ